MTTSVSSKERLHDIIFKTDTFSGRLFDGLLLLAISGSVLIVMLDSVQSYRAIYGKFFLFAEWAFTFIFTIEYALRIWVSERKRTYLFSFYGIIDLLSILPTFIAFILPGGKYLLSLRAVRLLRIFRILKFGKYVFEADQLKMALAASRQKITVFLFVVVMLTIILGTVMYVVEGEAGGFTNIPISIYWAIVTITTVGYGDISPITPLGQLIASVMMILGYGIIAIPTGIVTVELGRAKSRSSKDCICEKCGKSGHEQTALFCNRCGTQLEC